MVPTCKDCTYYSPSGFTDKCKGCELYEISPVTKPAHYQLDIKGNEVKDLIRDRLMGASVKYQKQVVALAWYKDAIKYLMRWYSKDGIQDLKKCKECIDLVIEELERKQ